VGGVGGRRAGAPAAGGAAARRPPGGVGIDVRGYAQIEPFTTLDGSEIREWAGRVSLPARNQSLAEATIPVGGATTEHYHRATEELYLVTAGAGRLVIDGDERAIAAGDCALIPPGARHKLLNTGEEPLRVVCACAPAYSDEDTCLTE
jgi:mannose-6-phosphate isomerase-like protein (cupin superfamily)